MRLIDVCAEIRKIDECLAERKEQADTFTYRIFEAVKTALEQAPTVDATVFPCKIGDPVWFVGTSNTNRLKEGIIETTVEKLVLKSGGIYMKLSCNAMYETSCRSIGKSIFFSPEEAEKALAERNKE